MPSISFVSTALASSSSSSSRGDSVGAGGIGGEDKVQMSGADALRTQLSPADALKAGWLWNGLEAREPGNFDFHGLFDVGPIGSELGAAIGTAGEASKQAACELKASPARIELLLAELQGAQEDVSPTHTNGPQEAMAFSSSLSSSLAQASYHSEPDKHL